MILVLNEYNVGVQVKIKQKGLSYEINFFSEKFFASEDKHQPAIK